MINEGTSVRGCCGNNSCSTLLEMVVDDFSCKRIVLKSHLFPLFLSERKVIGADALATGHYVQTNAGDTLERLSELDARGEVVKLFKGVDPGKDQSFFLSRVSQVRFSCELVDELDNVDSGL